MTFRLTDSTAAPPPGFREWTAAERAQVDELLAETAAATAYRKPGAKPRMTASAKNKADPHGWQAIIARVACPTRFQAATKADKA